MPRRRPPPVLRATVAALVMAGAGTSFSAVAVAAPPRAVGVHLTARTSLAKIVKPTVLVDRGTISGSPIGKGRVTLVYTLRPVAGIAITRFSIVNARGRITGRAVSRYSVTRLRITFTGAAFLAGGTRAYKGIRGRPLAFSAVHSLTGRREVVTLRGRATRP